MRRRGRWREKGKERGERKTWSQEGSGPKPGEQDVKASAMQFKKKKRRNQGKDNEKGRNGVELDNTGKPNQTKHKQVKTKQGESKRRRQNKASNGGKGRRTESK